MRCAGPLVMPWSLRPGRLKALRPSGTGPRVRNCRDNWIFICQILPNPALSQVFPAAAHRDTTYEFARDHTTPTWQKQWWRTSGDLHGLFIRYLCEAWSCTVESLLAPVERRNWSDTYALDDETLGSVSGYFLQRPSAP